MRRRDFIQTTALSVAGAMSFPSFLYAGKRKRGVGLQIYTLRESIFKDPKGVLKQVADFGYEKLETFAYDDGKIFGMSFSEFGKYVKDLGLKVTSGHYSLDQAKSENWESAVADAKSIGQEYMVVPYINEPERQSIDDYKRICESLNKAGEICNKHDIRFGYHNHAFEFDKIGGQIPYDMMLTELDPALVSMELDIFWVVNAGHDPIRYFEQHPGRFEQWHVKDMDKSDRMRNADIGQGTINWKKIFANAKKARMKHFYVEQETYPDEPMASVESGIKYLKSIL